MAVSTGSTTVLPPSQQAIVTGVYLFVWLVTSAFISATVDNISNTKYVRERGVNVMLLMIANVSSEY